MAYLKINQLSKTYGVNLILDRVSLQIARGELVALLGPSGCGKTTILRCIAGLEIPDKKSGEILLGERVLSKQLEFVPPEKRNFGMVFQSYAVWPHMTVSENLFFPLAILIKRKKISKSDALTQLDKTLQLVRLTEYRDRYPQELSGGQQQRVALGRALVTKPDLLLLDEPLSNLDALLREEIGFEIRRLQRELGLTAILVTHDRQEALSLSDRIVLMNRGRIEADGEPESLYRNPVSDFCAEFLCDAQRLRMNSGEERLFLPQGWRIDPHGQEAAQILARKFLGNKFEYLGRTSFSDLPIRFFSEHRIAEGQTIRLRYSKEIDK